VKLFAVLLVIAPSQVGSDKPRRFKGGTPNVRTAQDVVHGKLPFVREAIRGAATAGAPVVAIE
jgi:hypothetical protein